MPIVNSLKFNAKLSDELDKKFVQDAVTGMFTDNAAGAKFVGTHTVLIDDAEMTGMGDYDREKGFAKGAVTINQSTYELEMDRSVTFTIDGQDLDEIGVSQKMAGYMSQFVTEHSAPEVDAYVLSKLAGVANERGNTVSGDPATQAYKMFTEAQIKVQRKAGHNKELVAFVDYSMWAAIMNTPEIARQLVVSNFKKGDVDLQVKSLNGVAIIPVTDERMYTAYDFLPGSVTGESAGGFEPMENAKNIGLLMLPKDACSLIKKTEKTRIFSPEQNLNADAWKGDYRIYYGCLVKKSNLDKIVAYTYEAA